MRNLVKHIPNTLTCANLAFGVYAIILSFSGNYPYAMVAVFMAALFDFTDGFAARLLKAFSPIGKDLDSLADIVSFGVAPGMMLYCFLRDLATVAQQNDSLLINILMLSSFAIPIFSALRLAKFNIDTRQKKSFIGLPVPAHAILWASLLTALVPSLKTGNICLISRLDVLCFNVPPVLLISVLAVLAIITSLLLVSEIPMFSLKISSLAGKENKPVLILFLTAIVFIALFGILGVFATMVFYILYNVFGRD
ncbi:MAG: CDP-alcohol phosphatidyltransferase family protein [Tannerella sp.]|jgi:CDP-diacylglycerol--serine O-phosphatidyltransferase|nr:CDP-alcohol phosphatidyltransferase family protein [Tannerella sp.]